MDLALRLMATSRLISLGMLVAGWRGFSVVVAAWAACCRTLMKLLVAASTSVRFLSCIVVSALSRTMFLYVTQFVCDLCSRGIGCLFITVVLMVTFLGVWSEVRSYLAWMSAYMVEIPLVTKKSRRSGIFVVSEGQYVGGPVDI
jgi:hypothetical protein